MIGPLREMHVRGVQKIGFVFTLALVIYKLVRLCSLVGPAP